MLKEGKNFVKIVGYLKEDELKLGTSKNGDENVSGNLTIALPDGQEFRLWYYSNRYKKPRPGETRGEEGKPYKSICKLLPEKVVTLNSLVEGNPSAPIENLRNAATKVRCIAKFEERFFKGNDDEVHSQAEVRGVSADIITDKFESGTYFKVTGFVDKIDGEKDRDGNETGRAVLDLLMPTYNGSVHSIRFVSKDATVGEGMLSMLEKNETYELEGELCRLEIVSEPKEAPTRGGFGQKPVQAPTTRFVNERQIVYGTGNPLEGEDKMEIEDVKEAKVLREEAKARALEGSSNNASRSTASASAPAQGGFGQKPKVMQKEEEGFQDVDF